MGLCLQWQPSKTKLGPEVRNQLNQVSVRQNSSRVVYGSMSDNVLQIAATVRDASQSAPRNFAWGTCSVQSEATASQEQVTGQGVTLPCGPG